MATSKPMVRGAVMRLEARLVAAEIDGLGLSVMWFSIDKFPPRCDAARIGRRSHEYSGNRLIFRRWRNVSRRG